MEILLRISVIRKMDSSNGKINSSSNGKMDSNISGNLLLIRSLGNRLKRDTYIFVMAILSGLGLLY